MGWEKKQSSLSITLKFPFFSFRKASPKNPKPFCRKRRIIMMKLFGTVTYGNNEIVAGLYYSWVELRKPPIFSDDFIQKSTQIIDEAKQLKKNKPKKA